MDGLFCARERPVDGRALTHNGDTVLVPPGAIKGLLIVTQVNFSIVIHL